MKTCTRCKQTLPLEAFGKVKMRGKERLRPCCKACHCLNNKEWVAAHAEQVKKHRAIHYQENRDAIQAKHRVYYEAHREHLLEKMREWVKNHPEQANETKRRYVARHPDRVKQSHQQWERENREYSRIKCSLRKARRRASEGRHTLIDRIHIYIQQKGRCFYCNTYIAAISGGHFDHMVPLARGGSDGPENLAFSCVPCNLKKGNRTPEEWMLKLPPPRLD